MDSNRIDTNKADSLDGYEVVHLDGYEEILADGYEQQMTPRLDGCDCVEFLESYRLYLEHTNSD